MLVSGTGEQLSVALLNAVLLALWAALPGLFLAYLRQTMAARRMRPEFSLRKSETVELERAVPLYEKVCRRLKEIDPTAEAPSGLWQELFKRPVDVGPADADELEDLRAHAQHLRAAILRLKRRPLQRLQNWVHVVSARCAFGRALAVHVLTFALLVAAFHVPGQAAAAWADGLRATADNPLVWYPLDERLFYANAVAAGFAVAAAPVFYLMRQAVLRREYELEFCVFTDLAESDPARAVEPAPTEQPAAEASPQTQPTDVDPCLADGSWVGVLGVSAAPTLDEVKEAYKALIKQNHPDRVHDMSPAFRELAEAETKKITAAYRQALQAPSVQESERSTEPV